MRKALLGIGLAALLVLPVGAEEAALTADTAIVSVKSYGFVDVEGAKTSAIIVEYDREIDGDSVSAEDYEVMDYTLLQVNQLGYEGAIEMDYDGVPGNEGTVIAAYVNTEPAPCEEGKEAGKYVILEVNTEYMLTSQNLVYTESMMAGAKQVGEVTSAGSVIAPGEKEVGNYTSYEVENAWTHAMETAVEADKEGILLPQFDPGTGWTLHYIGENAFQATNCYSEYTGETYDFELPYALYVPSEEVMEANKGNIAFVVHMEHAGANDTDPMAGITSSKAASKLAGPEVQDANPAIVLVPQIEESRRTTDDYDASSEAQPAIWELMDALLEEYADYIDMDRIYGTGQSMGGMSIIYMASQRDNFFGGIAVVGAQWSNSYAKEFQHDGAPMRTPENDPVSFNGFGLDAENYQNWYYMVSDDNILVHTCAEDPMATGEWDYLAQYYEAAGAQIATGSYDPYLPVEEQDELDSQVTDHPTDQPGGGINWILFTSGNHMSTWKYGYQLNYPFQWLFAQSRKTEEERGKVEALKNDWLGRDEEGNILPDSGTAGLNSAQFTPGGSSDVYVEGWTPVSVTNGLIAKALEEDPAAEHQGWGKSNTEQAQDAYALLTEEEKAQVEGWEELEARLAQ